MDRLRELDSLLRGQALDSGQDPASDAYGYALCMAAVEHVIVVVSDLVTGHSRIVPGDFAGVLGLDGYKEECSIWETKILSRMPQSEREEKIIAELRFFHFLRHHPKSRGRYYLMSKLRLADKEGRLIDVLHRMYYVHDEVGTVRYAVCVYGPLAVDFKGRSVAVDSLTGLCEELTSLADSSILSARERQVLALIESGMRTSDIAACLHISQYTVSRHRQAIISKLQVKNSVEACRLAKSMGLL